MAVLARPSSIRILNFRGIPALDLELAQNMTTYLIGPNNAGKSTVLNAVALAFKDANFHTYTPGPYDYFRDSDGAHSETFSVAVRFSSDQGSLPAVQGVGSPEDVHGIQVRGTTDRRGRLMHRQMLLGQDGNPIVGDGRVARPFGFALTDPDLRLSRIRLLPELNRCVRQG